MDLSSPQLGISTTPRIDHRGPPPPPPPRSPKTPRLGMKVPIHSAKYGYCKVVVTENNGRDTLQVPVDPFYDYEPQQMLMEFHTHQPPRVSRSTPLETDRLELGGTVQRTHWVEDILELLRETGQDGILWLRNDDGMYKHVVHDFEDLTSAQIHKWTKQMLKEGLDGNPVCQYDVTIARSTGKLILGSLGPKLLDKVVQGGTKHLDGLTAMFRVLTQFGVHGNVSIHADVESLTRLSIKDSPTVDIGDYVCQVLTLLKRIQHVSKTAIVERHLSAVVARIFYVSSLFTKETHDTSLAPLIIGFWNTNLSRKMDIVEIETALESLADRHRVLKTLEIYESDAKTVSISTMSILRERFVFQNPINSSR